MAGNILWVNYEAGNMRTRPHRDRIFRHIQNNYRPRDKQEKAKALRISAKIPKSLRVQKPTVDDLVEVEDNEHPRGIRSVSPESVLKKGNSDPFHALAVPIEAEENRIVTFYRDFILPAEYNVDAVISRDILANVRAKADWDLHVTGLHDKGTALAFIASNASLVAIASNSNSLHNKSLALRSKSMKLLREKLTVVPRSSPLLWWHIDMIWTAEIAANNGPAARVHGDMLSKLMHEYFDAGGSLFDVVEEMKGRRVLELMLFFIYPDCNMATLFLIRPSFDVYEWLPKIFAPFLAMAEPALLPVPEQPYELDPIIDSLEMAYCFDTCREIFTRWRERKAVKLPEMAAMLNMCQGLYKWAICLGKLISRYCTFHEICQAAATPTGWEYAQQYLSLSALRWSKAEVHNDAYGKNLWAGKVMDALHAVLERSKCAVGSESFNTWKNARLWAFYVGAIFEYRKSSTSEEWLKGWFNSRFVHQATAMGLTDWDDVVAILQGFLFDPAAHEKEKRWFDKAMKLSPAQKADGDADDTI
ncbi:hypothetical protein H2200_013110 [Cladophialophora chaetospira]|uniref:Uncharacterized protein n=1 Tax=Cladophialophora chaetospira TaxID=386627 RepID=A0AA38WWV7_9EURO|nr:hypothetical protein H2200_013110 [Cladophialophora chaetospira]